ncbi:MAG: hypothetical protein K8J08_00375 [Thermoanaerobaculia bacterium]|nr:hypothetical protein [Thermoanaerobaculia bacterium]
MTTGILNLNEVRVASSAEQTHRSLLPKVTGSMEGPIEVANTTGYTITEP